MHRFLQMSLLSAALMATVVTAPTALKAADDHPMPHILSSLAPSDGDDEGEHLSRILDVVLHLRPVLQVPIVDVSCPR